MAFLWLILAAIAYLVVKFIGKSKDVAQQRRDDTFGTFRGVNPEKESKYAEEERRKLDMHIDNFIYGNASLDHQLGNSPLRMYLEKHPEEKDEYVKIVAAQRIWDEGYRSYYVPQPVIGDYRIVSMKMFKAKAELEFPNEYFLFGIFAPDDEESYNFYAEYDYDASVVFNPAFHDAMEQWNNRQGIWAQPSLMKTYFEMNQDTNDAMTYLFLKTIVNMWVKWSDISERPRNSRNVFFDRARFCGDMSNLIDSSEGIYTCPESEMISKIKFSGSRWDAAVERWNSISNS